MKIPLALSLHLSITLLALQWRALLCQKNALQGVGDGKRCLAYLGGILVFDMSALPPFLSFSPLISLSISYHLPSFLPLSLPTSFPPSFLCGCGVQLQTNLERRLRGEAIIETDATAGRRELMVGAENPLESPCAMDAREFFVSHRREEGGGTSQGK